MRLFAICLVMGLLWMGRAVECLAQSTKYSKVFDNPNEAINLMINVTPIEGYLPSGKYSQAALLFGANGMYGITSRLGAEASIASSYFTTKSGVEGVLYYQAGVFFHLLSKEKVKNTRVVLRYKRYRDVNTRSESTTYIEVPARVKIATGIRGGIDVYHSSVVTDGIKLTKATSRLNLSGAYAGIQTANKHLIKTQFAGQNETVVTGALFRLYADVMYYPVSELDNLFLQSKLNPGNLGYRAGINYVPAPYGKKNQPAKYNPLLRRANMHIELGSRPVDGFFIRGGVSWGIIYR